MSLSESSRDSGDDYREKPEGRGARDRETEGQERDTLEGLSIPPSGRAGGRREQGDSKGDWGEWDTTQVTAPTLTFT